VRIYGDCKVRNASLDLHVLCLLVLLVLLPSL
jgi:hypothetical protein